VNAKKARGTPADTATRAAVRSVIDRVGWARGAELLGISQHAIERLLAGAPVLRTTAIAARVSVASLEEASR
jgi:hypothetical protein